MRRRDWVGLTIAVAAFALAIEARELAASLAAQRVGVRWAASARPEDRAQAEARHGLQSGELVGERTWLYRLADSSPAAIAPLVRDPLAEDTSHIDRRLGTVLLERADLPDWIRQLVEQGLMAYAAIGLGLCGLGGLLLGRRGLAWGTKTASTRLASLCRIYRDRALVVLRRGDIRLGQALTLFGVVWLVIVVPYVAVGPPDFEEYYTGVVSTKLAIDNLLHGAWPFWTTDLGLGTPLPFRFHFVNHPLAIACAVADCNRVLRVTAAVHLLLGASCIGLLSYRLARHRLLASVAACSYVLSSSAVQPMLTDDWPITAIGESVFPVLLTCALFLSESATTRSRLTWSLALGLMAGLLISMAVPVPQLTILALVALSMPGGIKPLGWFVLSAVVAVAIGSAQLHHLIEEVARNPGLPRTAHGSAWLGQHLWSTFLRPLPAGTITLTGFRSAFWGVPFAFAAVAALLRFGSPSTRWMRVGFVLGVVGLVVPPAWLFDIQTAPWLYRTFLNVFGILLAVSALGRLASTPGPYLRGAMVAQMASLVLTVFGAWLEVAMPALGLSTMHPRLRSPGIAEEIADIEHRRPGRVAFTRRAGLVAASSHAFNLQGLATNQLGTLGVPLLTAYNWGITSDELHPQEAMIEGSVHAPVVALQNPAWRDVLGVRYVLALPNDDVGPGLRVIRTFGGALTLLENNGAWPAAFFVDGDPLPTIPRLPGCAHDRFLCADFAQSGLRRTDPPVRVTPLRDGYRLDFPSAAVARRMVVTQWFREDWAVTAGRATLERVSEQFMGVHVQPGEGSVTVRYRPRLRAALLLGSVLVELAVALLLAYVWWTSPRAKKHQLT